MGRKSKKQIKDKATELALLLYDIYKEAPNGDNMQTGQKDASKRSDK